MGEKTLRLAYDTGVLPLGHELRRISILTWETLGNGVGASRRRGLSSRSIDQVPTRGSSPEGDDDLLGSTRSGGQLQRLERVGEVEAVADDRAVLVSVGDEIAGHLEDLSRVAHRHLQVRAQ